jgi:hypothetical protein
MSKSILLAPVLILLTIIVIVVLLLTALLGGFGGGGGADHASGGGGGADTSAAKPQPARESKQGTLTAGELKVGDCISDANSRTGDVTTFHGVKCDAPHDGEVYTLITLKGGDKAKIPSEAFVQAKGQRGCRARLRRQATNRQFHDRQLGFKFVYPTPDSWAEGDREITCVATFRKPRSRRLAQRSS